MKKIIVLLSVLASLIFGGCAMYPRVEDYGRTPDLVMLEALSVPDGQTVTRSVPESQYYYTATPLTTYIHAGRECRKISVSLSFRGRKEQAVKVACKFNGQWYLEEPTGWARGYGAYPYGRPYGHLNLWGNFNFR
jgi:uncharacterized protein YxeA